MVSYTNYGVDHPGLSVEMPEITLRAENLVNKNVEESSLAVPDNCLKVRSVSATHLGLQQSRLRTVFTKWRGVAGLCLGLLVTLALAGLVPILLLQNGSTTSEKDDTEDTTTKVTQWVWVSMGLGACLFLVLLVLVRRRCEP